MTALEIASNRLPAARSSIAFLAFAAAVVAVNALLVRNYARFSTGPAPEWPVMVDLLLVVPLVFLALNWRQGKAAAFRALALVSLGALAGSLILPDESKNAWHVVDDLRYVALAVVVMFQLGLITLLLTQVARERHSQNLELALDRAISARFGDSAFTRALRLESRVWLYGLFRRPIRQAFPGLRHFHVGKQGMNATNQLGFLIAIGAEIPIAHVLIHLFDPLIAAVVTALSAYGFVFMLAEYRATLYRPLSVTERGLQVRYGVASDFLLEWSSIATVEPTRGPVRRAKGRLRLIGMGEANVLIGLAPGTRVRGLAGSRVVDQIYLGVDDSAGLIAELRARAAQDSI
ncbi:hypothetical protein [Cognatilysobacter bugurensis]|uniref:Uncharacterized protein n=1 Tax=Cognatilysobacter bugurensis TaxID=543356 RepID=A0A918T1B3_9GAMM|nr:hypothetical protein [Lysobacter bugurensis]GHA83904.1 hypothetical protein GCM10007067_22560 [Lysobacter bugurensis]